MVWVSVSVCYILGLVGGLSLVLWCCVGFVGFWVLVGCYDYGFGCNYGWCAVVSIAACSGLGGLAVCGCSGLGCFGGLSLVLLVVSLIAIYGYWFVFGRVRLSFVGYGLSGVGVGGCLLLWYFYLLL